MNGVNTLESETTRRMIMSVVFVYAWSKNYRFIEVSVDFPFPAE